MSSTTTNYNLFKPDPGASGVAEQLNSNLDTIDNTLKSLSDNKEPKITKKSAFNKDFGIGSDDVSRGNHGHTDYASKADFLALENTVGLIQSSISAIQNTLNLMQPDLSSIAVNADINNRHGGIKISCMTEPAVCVRSWNVKIRTLGNLIYNADSNISTIFISRSMFESSLVDNTELAITITANSGSSTKDESFSHIYIRTQSDIDIAIANLENVVYNELSMGNILDAVAQDVDTIQAHVNVLQHSNVLVQKLADLLRQS